MSEPKPVRFDLAVLRGYGDVPTPADAAAALPVDGATGTPITRRTFLELGGLSAAVPFLPQRENIRFEAEPRRATFYLDERAAWVIDADTLANGADLVWSDSHNRIQVLMRGARFAGTKIAADVACDCRRIDGQWISDIRVGAFCLVAPLADFLAGRVVLRGAVGDTLLPLDACDLSGASGAIATLTRDWHMLLVAATPMRLWFDDWTFGTNRVSIRPVTRTERPLLGDAQGPRTILTADRGANEWYWWERRRVRRRAVLNSVADPFDAVSIEIDESSPAGARASLVARSSGEGKFGFEPDPKLRDRRGEVFRLPLRDVGYAATIAGDERTSVLVANASLRATWLDANGMYVAVGDIPTEPVFELHERADRVETLRVDPAVVATLTPMDDALIEASSPSSLVRLSLADMPAEAGLPRGFLRPCGDEAELEVCLPECCIALVRPEDLLTVCFEFRNLAVRRHPFRKATIERCGTDEAYLIVHFPPQHVGEQAFTQMEDGSSIEAIPYPPVGARLSGGSRIALRLRPGINEIDYTIESLLDWERFFVATVPDERSRYRIAAPGPEETAIEMPYRLILSPDKEARWRHSAKAVRHGDRTELWHTRLTDQFDDRRRAQKVRAVWSPDFRPDPKSDCDHMPRRKPFLMSLDDRDRHEIVRLSHDALTRPDPIDAHLLMLSPLGGWADLEGSWPWSEQRIDLPLEKWEHVITMGRDQYAKIERRGFLYPYGHRATLVTETERQVMRVQSPDGKPNYVAYLRQRKFIECKEPTKAYEYFQMSFREVTFTETRSPYLDFELNAMGQPVIAGSIPRLDRSTAETICERLTEIGTWGEEAFWPTVKGEPWRFPIQTKDRCGNTVHCKATVIFVEDRVSIQCTPPSGSARPTARERDASCAYSHPNNAVRRQCELNGQVFGLAECRQKGDTEVTAAIVAFEGLLRDDVPDVSNEPAFRPVVQKVRCNVPALDYTVPGGGGETWLAVRNPDDGSPREVFAAIIEGFDLNSSFERQSDRSGGVVAPTVDVTHLSRRFGPIGLGEKVKEKDAILVHEPMTSANGDPTMDPEDFFKDVANIFGRIKLSDIVNPFNPSLPETVPKILSLLEEWADGPPRLLQTIAWSTTDLRDFNFPEDQPFLRFVPNGELRIDGTVSAWIDAGVEAEVSMQGALRDFTIELTFEGSGIGVDFDHFTFRSGTREKTTADVAVRGFRFLGALEFVQNLANYLKLGGEDGVAITIRPTGVLAQLPPIMIPSINVGALGLQDLSITTWCTLPFNSEPIEIGIDISRPDRPFLVTVGAFSGGGYFGLTVDSDRMGIRRMAAAFEFGVMKQISFGSIAHGSLYVFGGIYYQQDSSSGVSAMTFSAYVRAGGEIEALGLISLCIELYLRLDYNSGSGDLIGRASLTHSFKIGFVKKSFSISYEERFAGSGSSSARRGLTHEQPVVALFEADVLGDRTARPLPPANDEITRFRDTTPLNEWCSYWNAFAD